MSSKVQEVFSEVDQLRKAGEYQAALEKMHNFAKVEELSSDEHLDYLILESKTRLGLGETETALALAEEVKGRASPKENPLLFLDASIIIAESCWKSQILDKGLHAIEEGIKLLEKIQITPEEITKQNLNHRKALLLHHGGLLLWYKGDLDQSLEFHQRSLTIKESLGDKQGIAASLNNLGLACWSKGNLDQAIAFYQQCLAIQEKLGNELDIARTLNNLGNALAQMGDLDLALEKLKQSLAIKEKLGLNYDTALAFNNIGVIYRFKGDLDQAFNYYQRSLNLHHELGGQSNIALALGNLGDIHTIKGNLDQALSYLEQSLQIYEVLGLKQEIARTLNNLGDIYKQKEDLQKASDLFNQSLKLYRELENDLLISVVLLELVRLALHQENHTLARQHLEALKQLKDGSENRVIDQRYRVAKALSLKSSKRARHMVQAGEILEQVIEEEVMDHFLTTKAMIHLCDLLVLEFKVTGDEQVFEQVKSIVQRLLNIAETQSSHSLLVEATLLQSKIALVELDIDQSMQFLKNAQKIAEEKGLHLLVNKIDHERNLLQNQIDKWEHIIQHKPSRQEMVDLTQLDDLVERMIHKTVAVLTEEEKGIAREDASRKKYELVFQDLLRETEKSERNRFRVGIAQMGLSQKGNLLHEFYEESSPGLFGLKEELIDQVRSKVSTLVETARSSTVDLLIFPELTIDFNHRSLVDAIHGLALTHGMHILPGSYHKLDNRQNVSTLISPDGILWEQAKHIPAMIHFEGNRLTEGIHTELQPRKVVIGNTEFGRIAIVICRDFLDMDLRVALKNADPPIDILINPAFTPVTADFRAAHFDARRSIYAYCFFANVAEFGDSLIYSPEKDRIDRSIPAGEEGIIYKDVDLFNLRSERNRWEIEQRKTRSFIQSTR
jgi:tetratricopeptide (TPR) repeat protein/predicted amidohydrolase